jgi:hypothetical protein
MEETYMSIELQRNIAHAFENSMNGMNGIADQQTFVFGPKQIQFSEHLKKLQDRMAQLEKVIINLNKKESYVSSLASDLEHIILHLINKLDSKNR